MSETVDRYRGFRENLPENITLVAISKTMPENDILDLYNEGHRVFGENKVQELTSKAEKLPDDIKWHMVGHLQTNKVKYIAGFISLIHSIDRIKLLRAVNKEAGKNERVIDCLLQVHIAEEETKFGFSDEELKELINVMSTEKFEFVRIRGLMGMATFTDDMDKVRQEFKRLKSIFVDLKKLDNFSSSEFDILSMGMSNDYQVAIEEGANMIRIGSLIFGERIYH
jgi:hypothetical protein